MATHVNNSCESIDDALDQVRQFADRWQNKPSLEDFNIAKSYIEGRLHILVFFRIAEHTDNYVAFLRNRQWTDQGNRDGFLFGGRGSTEKTGSHHPCDIRITDSVVYATDTLSMSKDQRMLVGDIHLVKSPEVIIPSEIRLQEADALLVGDAHALYFSRRLSYILCGTLANREVRTGENRRSIISNQTCSQMVQGCPEVVNSISDNQTDSRIDFGHILNNVIGVGGLRVVLGANFARASCEKNLSPRIEISDVVVGPIKF